MALIRQVLDRPIQAEATVLDDGIVVTLTGGERSHIGAAAVAAPDGQTQTLEFPGHREREVAEQRAQALARACGLRTTVVCGIH